MARAAMVRAVMRRPHILVTMPAVRSLTARGHPAHRERGAGFAVAALTIGYGTLAAIGVLILLAVAVWT